MIQRQNDGIFKQVRSNFDNFFLSNSARNKKFDGEKQSFDFSEIQDAIKNRSLEQLLESDSAPAVIICAVITFITIFYLMIALFTSSYVSKYELPAIEYNNNLLIEIEEVLSKLMYLKKNGNMNEYEAFLQPTMQKYCLDHLEPSYLDTEALESFHMNLAETVSFISRGGSFTQHKSLKLTKSGGIIDPSSAKNPAQAIIKTKPCPLLNALYELGSAGGKDPVAEISNTKNEIQIQRDNDSDEKFNQKYSWENMEEFLNLISIKLSKPGECLQIVKELEKNNMKSFVLNFYEMTEIIGKHTAKEEEDGVKDLGKYQVDPSSTSYRKYVVGRDGGVYETDGYDGDTAEYLHCNGIEQILNDKFVLDDNLSYTNVKIAIDEKFDDWYLSLKQKFNF